MAEIKCKVIPEPAEGTRAVLKTNSKVPHIRGEDGDSYHRGSCDFVLAENVFQGQLRELVLLYPRCIHITNYDPILASSCESVIVCIVSSNTISNMLGIYRKI
ncbi:MAG: hypothetical protein M3258_03545 [Thermoproteota archaeon]|nr:hypothetical protein [Thermoproteota archaeon]